jgi:molecular chaperone GrpE
MSSPEETSNGPVIRDLRRIDPATGQVRNPRPSRHAASRPGAVSGGAQAGPGTGRPPGAGTGPGGPGATAPGGGTTAGQDPGGGAAAGSAATGGRAGGGGSAAAGGGAPQDTAARQDASAGPGGVPGPGQGRGSGPDPATLLAERTADLQRVTAEYANYRKRVERDRLAVREQALANVLSSLLPVLDDIGRADEHGELVGGFKSVADSLIATVAKLGLVSFGEEGERFDPRVHEALSHSYSAEVTEPTCVRILQPGYKVGERILRPARVAVAEPASPAGTPSADGEPGEGAPAGEAGAAPAGEAGAAPAGEATAGGAGSPAGQAGGGAPPGTAGEPSAQARDS